MIRDKCYICGADNVLDVDLFKHADSGTTITQRQCGTCMTVTHRIDTGVNFEIIKEMLYAILSAVKQ